MNEEARKPRLAIVCLYGYPLFRPEVESPFGGSEVRVSILARGLAARGRFDVQVVVFDHEQPKIEPIDGVTIRAWPGLTCPIPTRKPKGLAAGKAATQAAVHQAAQLGFVSRAVRMWHRWFRPEPSPDSIVARIGPDPLVEKDVSFFRELDADVYMMPGNSRVSAQLATWCRLQGRPYVMLSGSDGDFHPDYRKSPEAIGIYGLPGYYMNATIESASAHVVQNERQVELLQASWNRKATIVRNPVDLELEYPRADNPRDILWVGKSDWIKRPGLFLDLAERFPDLSFRMLMTFSNKEIWEDIHHRAAGMKNVSLVDYTPFNEVERYFAEARLFVNTSVFEGFPNAFLQAAKYGIPIVSLVVDPGDMLQTRGCGASCADNMETLASEVSSFTTNHERYLRARETILEYVRAHHEKALIAAQYEAVLKEALMAGDRAQRKAAK